MTKDVHIIDPCTSEEWREFVSEHPHADIFHHPAWLQMLNDVYGFRIFAVCLKDGKRICAGIPFADVRSRLTGNRWVAVPFSDHCRPLLPTDADESAEQLVSFLKQKQATEIPRIEIRWSVKSVQPLFHENNFVSHVLHLDKDRESLFKSFDKKGTQRSINFAEKGGVVVRECKTYEEFEQFYELQLITRQRLGVPAQPRSFFKGVWDHILSQGMGFALLAFKDSTPVAGGVFFKFNKTISYKYSASDKTFKLLQPNYAFVWQAIQRALLEGCTRFDFGRSEKENEGLRRFKRGWGAKEEELSYTILANRPPKSGSSTLETVAGVVIRNSPKFVCALSGELLYKHFA